MWRRRHPVAVDRCRRMHPAVLQVTSLFTIMTLGISLPQLSSLFLTVCLLWSTDVDQAQRCAQQCQVWMDYSPYHPLTVSGVVNCTFNVGTTSPLSSSSSQFSSSSKLSSSSSSSTSAPQSSSSSPVPSGSLSSSSSSSSLSSVFLAQSFGAYTNDGMDDTIALQNTINSAVNYGPGAVVSLASGTYNINRTLNIQSCSGLTFTGASSVSTLLLMNGTNGFITATSCQNLTMASFSVDYLVVPFTAGQITSVSLIPPSFVLQVVDPHSIPSNVYANTVLRYDVTNNRPASGTSAYEIFTTAIIPSRSVGNGLVNFTFGISTGFNVGDNVVVRYGAGPHAILASTTSSLLLQSINVYSSQDMGFVGTQLTNAVIHDWHVVRQPGRWLSTNADCLHITAPRVSLSITDSSCEGQGDDGLNVQYFYFNLSIVINSSAIVVSGPSWELTTMNVGDTLAISHANQPLTPYALPLLTAITSYGSNAVLCILSSPVVGLTVGDSITEGLGASLWISNFTAINNRARGILVETDNVVIQNSLFAYTSGPAILFEPDDRYWHQGKPAQNVTLVNNVFVGCNQGIAQQLGVITISASPIQSTPDVSNITITNNTFYQGVYSKSALDSQDGTGITFSHNFANFTGDTTAAISVCNTQAWFVSSNTFINLAGMFWGYDAQSGCSSGYTSTGNFSGDAFTACFGPSVTYQLPSYGVTAASSGGSVPVGCAVPRVYYSSASLLFNGSLSDVTTGQEGVVQPTTANCSITFPYTILPSGQLGQVLYSPCASFTGLSLPLTQLASSFTLESWMQYNTTNVTSGLAPVFGSSAYTYSGVWMGPVATNPPYVDMLNGYGASFPMTGGGLPVGWVHWALTFDNTTNITTIYINGNLRVSSTVATVVTNAYKMVGSVPYLASLGGSITSDASAYYYAFQVFNTSRSASQVRSDYASSTPAIGASVGALYSFEYPVVSSYQYNPPQSLQCPWTFTSPSGGIAYTASTFDPPAPATPPDGQQYAFLQTTTANASVVMNATIVGLNTSSCYSISFYWGVRSHYSISSTNNTLSVLLGPTTVYTSAPNLNDAGGWSRVITSQVQPNETSAVLSFSTVSTVTQDRSILIDSVVINSTLCSLSSSTAGSLSSSSSSSSSTTVSSSSSTGGTLSSSSNPSSSSVSSSTPSSSSSSSPSGPQSSSSPSSSTVGVPSSSSSSSPPTVTSSITSSLLSSSSSTTGSPSSSSSSPSSSSSSSSVSPIGWGWNLPLNGNYQDTIDVGDVAIPLNPNGTAYCAPSFVSTSLPSGGTGQAWYNPCGGLSGGLQLPYTSFPTNYTLEVWMSIPSLANSSHIIIFGSSVTSALLYIIKGSPPFLDLIGHNGFNIPGASSGYPIGWTHYAMTYSNTSTGPLTSAYINGSLVVSSAYDLGWSSPPRPFLGGAPGWGSDMAYFSHFTGWNTTFSASQIRADYLAVVSSSSSSSSSSTAGSLSSSSGFSFVTSSSSSFTSVFTPVSPSSGSPTVVYMLAGQSNMVGENCDDPHTPGQLNAWSSPNIDQLGRWTSNGYTPSGMDNFAVFQATDPLEHQLVTPPATASPGVGPGISFAVTQQQNSGNNILLIPCAAAGTNLGQWAPVNVSNPANSGSLYYDCVNRTNYALGLPGVSLGGVLWLQGEQDAQLSVSPVTYAQQLSSLVVSGFRRDLAGGTNAPFVLAQMSPLWVATGGFSGSAPIQQVITNASYNIPYTSVVYGFDTSGLPLLTDCAGIIHYAGSAARSLGVAYAYAAQAALKNYAGSSTPGIIVQVFVPAQISNSSLIPISWVPDPVATTYTVVIFNSTTNWTFTSQQSSTNVSLPSTPMVYYVNVTGVSAQGNSGAHSRPVQFAVTSPNYTFPSSVSQPWITLIGDSLSISSVLVWLDATNNGQGFVQPTAIRQPVHLSTNGLGFARFGGSSYLLSPTGLPVNSSMTIFLVIAPGPTQVGQPGNILANSWMSIFVQGGTVKALVNNTILGGTPAVFSYASQNTPAIVTVKSSLSSIQFYVNGVLQTSLTGSISSADGSAIIGGSFSRDPSLGYIGDIYSMVVVNGSVDDTSRSTVEQSLASKYNTSVAVYVSPTVYTAGYPLVTVPWFWTIADTLNTSRTSNQVVGTWVDVNTPSQQLTSVASEISPPTFVSNAYNGHAAVRVNQSCLSSNVPFPDSANFTVVIALQAPAQSSYYADLFATSSNEQFYILSGKLGLLVSAFYTTSSTSVPVSSLAVINLVFSSNVTGVSQASYFINSVAGGTASNSPVSSVAATSFFVGCSQSVANYLVADVMEVMLFATALDTTTLSSINTYLQNKY